jgi:thiosulfate dehydrogenase (quinone) large subunit
MELAASNLRMESLPLITESDSTWKDVSCAYALLRVSLGFNIFMHGAVRWAAGLKGFAVSLVPMFQKAPLPQWSVYAFGYTLPILEAAIGAAILLGMRTRSALVSGAMLMIVLTFGSTLRQDWPTVGIQLGYSFVYCALLAAVRFDRYSLNQLMARNASQ